MDIGEGVRISRRARLDKTNPAGIHIGDHTMITGGVAILTHDFVNRAWSEVHIGKHCFIGYNTVVMPGVTIGDGCIIGANSVVTRDIPAYSVAVGVPAKVLQTDIRTGPYGIRLDKGNDQPIAI
ncbi:MAG: acyltransferase [Pikeienuella sp.]